MVDLKFLRSGIKRWVIKYNCIFKYCVNCGKTISPIKYKNIRGKYGYGLISWIIYQNIENQVSLNKINKTLSGCFQISIGNSCLNDSKIKAAKFYQKAYNDLITHIKTWNIIHADETRVSVRGKNGYVWVFTNLKDVVFLFRETRETKFIHKLIENFEGVFISDFYKGYDSLNCIQQKCLIHLMRDINNDLFKNQQDEELKYIASNFATLLRSIVGTIDNYGLKKRNLNKHKKDVERFYKNIQYKDYDSEIAASFIKRFIRYRDSLFAFLNHEGVPWNNNNAEHAFKHFARHRRNIDGLFTAEGIKRYLIFLSIYQSCKYKDINFLKYLLSNKKQFESYISRNTACGSKRKQLGGIRRRS